MATQGMTTEPTMATEDREDQVRAATRRVLEIFQELRITSDEGRTIVKSLQSMNAARRRWTERFALVLGYFLLAGWALQLLAMLLFR